MRIGQRRPGEETVRKENIHYAIWVNIWRIRGDGIPSVRTSKGTHLYGRVRKLLESRNGVRKQSLLSSENLCWRVIRLLLGEEGTGRHGKNRKEKG